MSKDKISSRKAKPFKQPLFLYYDATTDELKPLTEERLQQFKDSERLLGEIIMGLRDLKQNKIDSFRIKNGLPSTIW